MSLISGMMSSILFKAPVSNIGFDDILVALKDKTRYIFISTMPVDMQNALIPNTIPCSDEATTINRIMDEFNTAKYTLIVYGKNACDTDPSKKYEQLWNLGFSDIHIFPGGMFEYILLNDMYGEKLFPISGSNGTGSPVVTVDIMTYRPIKNIFLPTR